MPHTSNISASFQLSLAEKPVAGVRSSGPAERTDHDRPPGASDPEREHDRGDGGRDGHQRAVVDTMQTREELYDRIGYHAFEQKLDALFAAGKK